MDYRINIARTLEEKERIYKFRYDVYITEMGRPAKADHEKRRITDGLDEKGINVYATTPNQERIVGAGRMNLKRDGNIEFEKEYKIERIIDLEYHIASSTKLMVTENLRKTPLTMKLISFMFRFYVEHDIKIDFININSPVEEFYKRLGYRRYTKNFRHPEFGEVIPMVLIFGDLKYLNESNSLFKRLANELYAGSKEVADNERLYDLVKD